MHPSPHLDALVAPLRADVVSGAAVIARTACEVVRRAALRVQADSVPEFREALATVGILMLDAQPAMAPLVALMRDVLGAVETATDPSGAAQAACAAADAFRDGLDRRAHLVAERVSALLPTEGDVLTLSSSSTVRACLLHRAADRAGRVVVLEGRPMLEGHMTAAALGRAGIPVTLAVDAAVATLVPTCSAVLLGADSVGDLGVVNKLGSLGVAYAAGRAGIPVIVATDATKILPPGLPQHLSDDRPGEEVGRANPGVRIWNRYFEVVPLELVTWIVTDDATLDAEGIARFRTGLSVPDEVRRWAVEREGPDPNPRT